MKKSFNIFYRLAFVVFTLTALQSNRDTLSHVISMRCILLMLTGVQCVLCIRSLIAGHIFFPDGRARFSYGSQNIV